MAFRRAPSASASQVDPVDFESYAQLPSHRRGRGAGEEGASSRQLHILHKAHTRDMRALLSLRSKTAIASKGRTTSNPIEAAMRERAEEAAHAAAEQHLLGMKRRLEVHLFENFAKADADISLELDWDEWLAWFGRKDTSNPLFVAGLDVPTSMLRTLFEDLDTDGDGRVSLHEFVTGVKHGGRDRFLKRPSTQHHSAQSKLPPAKVVASPQAAPQEQLESPLTKYRRRTRSPKMSVPELMKMVDTSRRGRGQPDTAGSPVAASQGEARGDFFGSIGMDTELMEADEIHAQVLNVFELFDDDQSGFLDFVEVKEGLQRFGVTPPVAELVRLMEQVGAGTSMQCDTAQFEKLLGLLKKPVTPPAPKPPAGVRREQGAEWKQEGTSSSSFSSSSSSDDVDEDKDGDTASEEESFGDQDDHSLQLPPTPTQRPRSPRGTQTVHDSALQLRLKKLESNLKNIIHSSQQTKEEALSSDVQTGKITHIAAEISHAGALYSGPVNAAGVPEGVGAIDYRKVGDARGRLTAERRSYYLGTVVAGKRQGLGLLRWMDRTEYCGSWNSEVPEGSGVETYEDGSWYAGGFKNDKRHGMGGIWTADGLVYMGQWKKGARHGAGIVAHADSVEVDLKGKGTIEQVSAPPSYTLAIASVHF